MTAPLEQLREMLSSKSRIEHQFLSASIDFHSDNYSVANVNVIKSLLDKGDINGEKITQEEKRNLEFIASLWIVRDNAESLINKVLDHIWIKLDNPLDDTLAISYIKQQIEGISKIESDVQSIRNSYGVEIKIDTALLEQAQTFVNSIPPAQGVLNIDQFVDWAVRFHLGVSSLTIDLKKFIVGKTPEEHICEWLEVILYKLRMCAFDILRKYNALLKDYYCIFNENGFISSLSKERLPSPIISTENDSELNKLAFEKLFVSDLHFTYIKNYFAKEKLCSGTSLLWTDERSGKGGFLIAVLKRLREQGFYKKEIKITHFDYQRIAENEFGIKLSPGTVRRVKVKDHDVSFIPSAKEVIITNDISAKK